MVAWRGRRVPRRKRQTQPGAQSAFEKGVALLQSFPYEEARQTFVEVAKCDAKCAMAHWGKAMALDHQLWDFPDAGKATDLAEAQAWLAFAQGKTDQALKELRAAADRQDKNGGDSVGIPAREMLADMLLEAKRSADALAGIQGRADRKDIALARFVPRV